MEDYIPPREADEINSAPDSAAEAVGQARRVKHLSNVFCFTLLTQQAIAVIGEVVLIFLYYAVNLLFLHNRLSLHAVKAALDAPSFTGEAASCMIYFSYMFIPFLLMVFILKQNPFRIVPVRRIEKKSIILPSLAFVFGFYFLADLLINYIQMLLGYVHLEATSPNFTPPGGTAAFLVYFFQICILAPFCEEFIFRGVILHSLKPFGNAFAVTVSAMLFSMVHGNLLQIPLAFLVGLLFGVLVIKSGSIWLTVLMHASVNAFSVILDTISGNFGTRVYMLVYMSVVTAGILAGVLILVYQHMVREVSFREKFREFRQSVLPNQFLFKKFTLYPGFLIFAAVTLAYVILYIRII